MASQDDARFIDLAIRQAAKSRHSGKGDPLVGAVVAKGASLIGTAHRGQKGKGDHAEFTLLHKVLRSKDRAKGATLYTTLEPCTSRNHDKLPCAEWVVQKRIRRVVIGILDPNPTICGRGYWHLVDHGVQVEFFPNAAARRVAALNAGFINEHRGPTAATFAFASAVQALKSPAISPFPGIGCGDALSLQDCPRLRDGWPLAAIPITLAARTPFRLPDVYRSPFRTYYDRYYEAKRFNDDNQKFMLTINPSAFSDAPSLELAVRPTLYSRVQFYRDTLAIIAATRDEMLRELITGSLRTQFPHSLCLHMIVVTSDNRILLTRRSPKVAYSPNTWAASVEEQLSSEDLGTGRPKAALAWGRRLLFEELGLDAKAYHTDALRLLAVFVEADILNVSLCAQATLRITSSRLDTVLRALPRTDYEFTEWEFVDVERRELLREVFVPRRAYHPTSRYRLLMAFLKAFGSPRDHEVYSVTGR